MKNDAVYFDRLQVVLLHGQAFTSKTWEELGTMAILAVNGYQALAMDLPGRGTLRNNFTDFYSFNKCNIIVSLPL